MKIQPWWYYWYGWGARFDALCHILRGHDIEWRRGGTDRVDIPEENYHWVCTGDIVCHNCPDVDKTEFPECTGLLMWCRGKDV